MSRPPPAPPPPPPFRSPNSDPGWGLDAVCALIITALALSGLVFAVRHAPPIPRLRYVETIRGCPVYEDRRGGLVIICPAGSSVTRS